MCLGYIIFDDYRHGLDLSIADIINSVTIVIFYPISIFAFILIGFTQWNYDELGDSIILKGKQNEN